MALGSSNPTSNLVQIKNIPIDNNKGPAGDGTQRVVLANDTPTLNTQLVAGTAIIGKSFLTDGTRDATVKAASTAAVVTDTALVTALSPNTPLPTGGNIIGKTYITDGTRDAAVKAASTAAVATDTALVTALSPNTPLPTGTNTIGRVNVVELYTEGVASSGSEKVFLMGAIREDVPSITTSADLQYSNLKVNNRGRLYTSITFDEPLPTGSNSIGKLATNTANTYIGDVAVTNTRVPIQAATFNITGVSILAGGAFLCNATEHRLYVGQVITISGTIGSVPGIGSIGGYTGTTTSYRISVTDGVNSFTLQTLNNGSITTGAGSAGGLVFTAPIPAEVSNLARIGGRAVSLDTGARDAGTIRVTVATNDVVTVTPTNPFTVNLAAGSTVALAAGTNITTSGVTEQSSINISTLFLVGTSGQFQVAATQIHLSGLVTLSGTAPTGTQGTISGYVNPTTYRISSTNGSTTFTLINLDGSSLTTTAGGSGIATGLTAAIRVPFQVIQSGNWNVGLNSGSQVIGKVELIASTANVGKVELLASTASIGKVELLASTASIGKLSVNDGVDIGDVTINNSTLAVTQSGSWAVTANYPSFIIQNISIVGNTGQFQCSPIHITVGQVITLSGVLSGTAVTGVITGYTNPTSYRVSLTNGSTTFTLVTLEGVPLSTTIGSGITGLSGSMAVASHVANISQFSGQNISMGSGTRNAGTQRITIATDDILNVSQNGTWNVGLSAGSNTIGKLAANVGVNIGDVTIDNTVITVSQNIAANLKTETTLASNQTLSNVTNLIQFNGTNITMKNSSTPAVAADTALVVAVSPNNSISVTQSVASNLQVTASIATGQTLATVTNLQQLNGQNISLNSGTRDAGTQRVTIATNDLVRTQGETLTNTTTTAFTNSLVVRNAAATLYMLNGFNNSGVGQFIQIHNSTALPSNGAAPQITFFVPPGSNFSFDFGYYGRYFSNGITVCNSTIGATLALGTANCWFDAQYK